MKQKATEMMQDYLDRDADALDGFEFLTMAEAGEVGHWEILGPSTSGLATPGARRVGNPDPAALLEQVRQGSLKLAAEEDPNETS